MTPARREAQILALRSWFGVDRAPSEVLFELIHAQPTFMTIECISKRCGISRMNVRRRVWELRQAMSTEAIDTHDGAYGITEEGLEECLNAFRQMRTDLEVA